MRDQYYRRLFVVVVFFLVGGGGGSGGGGVVQGAPEGSTGRLIFCSCFWRSPGLNLRSLVNKASDLSTAPWRLLQGQWQ